MILLTVACLTAGMRTTAQVLDFENERAQIVTLNGPWRFHTGDDLEGRFGWASRDFDDSSWTQIQLPEPWDQHGYRGYKGFAWYRLRIDLPEKRMPQALLIEHISSSYQIFVNGQLVGEFGGLPPNEEIRTQPPQLFQLPSGIVGHGLTAIAIRVWYRPIFNAPDGGGFSVAPLVGEEGAIADFKDYRMKSEFWESAAWGLQVPYELFGAVAGFILFFLRPTDREYLWFAIIGLTGAAFDTRGISASFYSQAAIPFGWFMAVTSCIWHVFFTVFVFSLLRRRRDWLFWVAITAAMLLPLSLPDLVSLLNSRWISISFGMLITGFSFLVFYTAIVAALYVGARQGNRDALLLVFPIGLNGASYVVGTFLQASYLLGYSWGPLPNRFFHLSSWPFPFGFFEIAQLFAVLSTLAILVARFARSRRDEQRMAMELESARSVQSVLFPTEVPQVLGFALAAVYKPATQVGGDLFQIIPTACGGVLAVIGDVSGKGMPAAMTVSLLVGTVRTLADYTQNPGEILAAMNMRMLGRSGGGFTTCLVLRADADGRLTVANAGHLAPYKNGRELAIQNGLPLGLDAGTLYQESTFELGETEQLTLMTDGVVEARSKTGELLGFERAATLSVEPAEAIARAAQAFGQDDDITVLVIQRKASAQTSPFGQSIGDIPASVAPA